MSRIRDTVSRDSEAITPQIAGNVRVELEWDLGEINRFIVDILDNNILGFLLAAT